MSEDFDNIIPDQDYLLRGVRPDQWDFDENRPRTGLLISVEISVDWSAKRTEDDFMSRQERQANGFGLIRLKAGLPREKGLTVQYNPCPEYEPDNEAHTLIKGKSKSFGNCVKDASLVERVRVPQKPSEPLEL